MSYTRMDAKPLSQSVVFIRVFPNSPINRFSRVSSPVPAIAVDTRKPLLGRRAQLGGMFAAALGGAAIPLAAQTIDVRQWQGMNAMVRQPEQVIATTHAEWRSLWSRVGMPAPDMFEPGRTNGVGIFLGPRADGNAVNLLSTSRRRDRIVVVFEERGPLGDSTIAQRAPAAPPARAVSGNLTGPSSFASPGPAPAPLTAPPARASSPWAIVLINRADLPVAVEQRLFR
jgi:hypothetical protein